MCRHTASISLEILLDFRGNSLCGGNLDGGFSASLLLGHDRGFADGALDFYGDEEPGIGKAAEFLCKDCLNKILLSRSEQCFGVGVIHFDTQEVRVFEKQLGGFGIGDFYIDCNLTN